MSFFIIYIKAKDALRMSLVVSIIPCKLDCRPVLCVRIGSFSDVDVIWNNEIIPRLLHVVYLEKCLLTILELNRYKRPRDRDKKLKICRPHNCKTDYFQRKRSKTKPNAPCTCDFSFASSKVEEFWLIHRTVCSCFDWLFRYWVFNIHLKTSLENGLIFLCGWSWI